MRKILLCLLCLELTVFGEGWEQRIVKELPPSAGNPRNSEGDFLRLKDGSVLYAYTHYLGNNGGDHARAELTEIRSTDDGETWSEPTTLLPTEGAFNIMSVSLLRMSDGTLGMFYLRKDKTPEGNLDCRPFLRRSADEGKTWSKSTICIAEPGYCVVNNSRVVRLPCGRILLPFARHAVKGMSTSSQASIFCGYSDDDGQTWQVSSKVANPKNVILQEPGVVRLSDGRILMYLRTDAGSQFFAFSSDDGQTWTDACPSAFISPASPASLRNIPGTEDLFMVWNKNCDPSGNGNLRNSSEYRNPLNAAILRSDLSVREEWILDCRTPEDERSFCYPAIFFIDAKNILVGYCAGPKKHWGLSEVRIQKMKRK